MEKILVTGATGFVGSNVCKKLLLNSEKNLIYVIVRRKRKQLESRVHKELDRELQDYPLLQWKNRIIILDGDLEKNRMGLTEEDYELLCENVTSIYHCAASIKFTLPYDEAKRVNCGGTKNILELVQNITHNNFDRLNYVSTAYIAGSYIKEFRENWLEKQQQFANTYEMTKFECEQNLQNHINNGVNITIYRPSIIGSDSVTGATHNNNIIFRFLKLFYKGHIDTFYCNKNSTINIVPIDYFVDAMLYISQQEESIGKTYNLVNKENTCVSKIFQHISEIAEIKMPEFIDLNQEIIESMQGDSFQPFFHYVNASHTFNDDEAENILKPSNIKCLSIKKEYFDRNIMYGKKIRIL